MENMFTENKDSRTTTYSIIGDSHSLNEDIDQSQQESLSKRLGEFTDLSNQENMDMENNISDIEIDICEFFWEIYYILSIYSWILKISIDYFTVRINLRNQRIAFN